MEKMLFSGVQSNSEVALIAIKGIKNQPGIAAKVFGAIAEEKINVELILQSIGRGENKDISFVVAQDEADHAVETLKKAFDEAFAKYDIILGPAAPTAAPKIGTSLSDPMKMYLSDIYTVAVNLAGLPGLTVPCSVNEKGLPIGVQLLGDCFREKTLFAAASAIENVRGGWTLPFARKETLS